MSSLLRRFDEVLCSVLGRIVALASNALTVPITRTCDVAGGLRQSCLIEIPWQGGLKRLHKMFNVGFLRRRVGSSASFEHLEMAATWRKYAGRFR